MCGRVASYFTWKQIKALAEPFWMPNASSDPEPSWNVAPTQQAPIIRITDGKPDCIHARWGLVPFWANDLKIGARMINARSETVAEKPAFRSAFKSRRCIVPISGFYEWQKQDDGTKVPHFITRADGNPMLLAGLWEHWDKSDEPVESFTIITTDANGFMSSIHDRMPAILEPEQVSAWLHSQNSATNAHTLLSPAADGILEAHPVSMQVNSPRHNGPELIEHHHHS
jgi:putative SOS response-associated peptidase YedK